MKKPLSFYSNLFAWGLLAFLLASYIFGWTTPSTNPPSSNLSAPINTGSQNQAKVGYLAVGTSTTPTYPLVVGGALKIVGLGTAPQGENGVIYYDSSTNKFKGYQGSSWIDLGGVSLWAQNGSNIYYNSGSVGIGTSTPQTSLDVTGNIILRTSTSTVTLKADQSVSTNLNADKLDGYDASDLLAAGTGYWYMTSGTYDGASAKAACASGYHMCWGGEWFGRKLNTSLNVNGGWGLGGWIWLNTNSGNDANGDCLQYTSNSATYYGIKVFPYGYNNTSGTVVTGTTGWATTALPCNGKVHVMCCSD